MLLIGWLSSWNERYIQHFRLTIYTLNGWLSSWNERYIQLWFNRKRLCPRWLSSWNERYIQLFAVQNKNKVGGYHLEMKGISNFIKLFPFFIQVVIILKWKVYPTQTVAATNGKGWLSSWNERYIQLVSFFIVDWNGGYHLEMKGISNWKRKWLKLSSGGYHLEMKGISNLGVTLTMVLRWWLSSQIRVFYANS